MPLVSIVTTFLNAQPFLPQAVESVINQTHEDWELLLVDDGSTDASTDIARRFARTFPARIRYLDHPQHENRGKSTSRNLAISEARGQYLAFLDADDVFLPHKLARQVAILDSQSRAGMIYGKTEYWYRWPGGPRVFRRNSPSRLGVRPNHLYRPPSLLTAYLKDPGRVPCLCSWLVRRELVEAVGMFDEAIQDLYEDQVLLAKLCLAAPVFVDGDVGERYRQHPGSSSQAAIQRGAYHPWWPHPAAFKYLTWLSSLVDAQGVRDEALNKALRGALRPYRRPFPHRFLYPFKLLVACAPENFRRLRDFPRDAIK